jgi:hypothetical protein
MPAPVIFTDPTGDSGTAPDIRTVSVSNDATGTYQIDVALSSEIGSTQSLVLLFDADANRSTGSNGWEDVVSVDGGSRTYRFQRWNGSAWQTVMPPTIMVATGSQRVVVKINRSDLGGSGLFAFAVETFEGDGSGGNVDQAPDSGSSGPYEFALQRPLALSLGAAHAGAAKASGSWAYGIAVVRSDTGKTVGSESTVRCAASGGGTGLKVISHGFVASGGGSVSVAVCKVRVPKALKGKVVHGTITVTYRTLSVTHRFTAHAH